MSPSFDPSPTGHDPAPRRGRRGRTVAALTVLAVVLVGSSQAGSAQVDPTVSPITTISPDGRTGTDGTRTLAVSQVLDLDAGGSAVGVSGSGYDEDKGIYVALCVIPPRNHVPSPCGGGVDTEGTQGAAQWISSDPPSYGVGLAQPYGPGGSFQTSFAVRAEISPGIDCRQVRCAIVTRNDHTRTADRSQDLIVPVTFRSTSVTTAPPSDPGVVPTVPGGATPTTTPVVTVPPLANPTTTAPAPTATIAPDGRSTSDGVRTLAVDTAADLDPDHQAVTVTGRGFDEARGIYVSLCAIAEGGAPGPCRSGSAESNRWVSSNPPDYGVGVAVPFEPGGTFSVDLRVAALIDATTDCRTTPCAIVARADDTAPADRTLDLVVPVTFAESARTTGTAAPAAAAEGAVGADDAEAASAVVIDDTPSSTGPVLAVAAVVVALAIGTGAIVAARRRGGAGSRGAPTERAGDVEPRP